MSAYSHALGVKINKVMNDTVTGVWEPEVIFSTKEGFSFKPRRLQKLDIHQVEPGKNGTTYMDLIQCSVRVTPNEYTNITKHTSGLECTIKLTPVDLKQQKVQLGADPIIIRGKVIIETETDPNKTQQTNFLPDDKTKNMSTAAASQMEVDLPFNILSNAGFTMRHTQCNGIYNNCNMDSILHFIAQQFAPDGSVIVTPNNTQTYNNLVIPPGSGISTIFGFMQKRYGVYSKGLSYHLSYNPSTEQDILYIYPTYDTDAKTNTANTEITILNARENDYTGSEHYHTWVDKALWIVICSKKTMLSKNAVGEENSGGTHVSANTDNQRDQSVVKNKDGSLSRDSKSMLTTVGSSNKNGSMDSTSQNVSYEGQRSNIYNSTSTMASNNGTMFGLIWKNAEPFAILPGQLVNYEFDDQTATHTVQRGRIYTMSYSSNLQESGKSKIKWMTFSCSLSIFLDPEKAQDDIVQYNS